MEKEKIDALLNVYFTGSGDHEIQKKIVAWLNQSKEHRIYYRQYSELWALQQLQPLAENKETNHLRLLNKLITRQAGVKRRMYLAAAGIAAIFIVGAISSLLLLKSLNSRDIKKESLYTEAFVPNGSRSGLVLPDGSTVWLNAGSRLRYLTDFGRTRRKVYLEGEAVFDVIPDSLSPFIIDTEDISTIVLGTRFAVKAYREDSYTAVTLQRGKVKVKHADGQTFILTPDQQLNYNKLTKDISTKNVDAARYLGWIDDKIYFTDESFETIANYLERIYNIKIILNSDKLKKEKFFGSFEKSDGIEHIMEMIDIDQQFQWSITKDTLYITNKHN
ncbi:MAG: FecR family protein [Mangrovibacterium sp.]